MFDALFDLIFPNICIGCNRTLQRNEAHLCVLCLCNLPETNYHKQHPNPIEKLFWGRAEINRAFAFLYFKKKGVTQALLHEIKYKNNQDLAVYLGNYYGSILTEAGLSFDGLVSVPLHKSKLRSRGYNQSDLFVKGLAETLKAEIYSQAVARKSATESQTKKGRFDRWLNVDDVFVCEQPELIANKHILICDDVITTGATLEALIQTMPANTTKSICAIAFPLH